MPLYDYNCPDCGGFRAWQRMSEAADPVECPGCARPASRLVVAPSLGILPSVTRRAHERNEKSAHEPRVVSKESGAGDHGHARAWSRPWPRAPARCRRPAVDDRPLSPGA